VTPAAQPALRFWVYRRTEQGSFGAPLNPQPIEETAYLDSTPEAESAGCYAVTAVATIDPIVESDAVPEQCAVAGTRRPPAPPQALKAAADVGGVDLSWSASANARVVAFRVYRLREDGVPERLAEIDASRRTYRDTPLPPGELYSYVVAAVDSAGRESIPETVTLARPSAR
jgi:fibronectin type 3 domain-containing protein